MKESQWSKCWGDTPQPITQLSDEDLALAAYGEIGGMEADPNELASPEIFQAIARGVIRMRIP